MDPNLLDVVVPAVAMLLGLWLKRRKWYPTKFVPIASYGLAVLLRLLEGLGVTPPAAGAQLEAAAYASAVFGFAWGSLGAIFWRALQQAIVDALIATGAHSGGKNLLEGLRAEGKKL